MSELLPTDEKLEVAFEEVIDAESGEITYRRRGAGRPPGSKNRVKTLEEKLEALGCDPIVKLAQLSMAAEQDGQRVLAMKGYSELAQYQHAKKKAVEVNHSVGGALEEALQMSSAERMLRVAELMQRLGSNPK